MTLADALRHPRGDTWEHFLREWRGNEVRGYAREELQTAPLPAQLLRYYEVAGRLDTLNLHLVPPLELEVEDGHVMFIVEERGVYAFATDRDGEEPRVYGTWDVQKRSWELERERLGRFLLQHALFEATGVGDLCGWGWVERASLPAFLALLPALPLRSWR